MTRAPPFDSDFRPFYAPTSASSATLFSGNDFQEIKKDSSARTTIVGARAVRSCQRQLRATRTQVTAVSLVAGDEGAVALPAQALSISPGRAALPQMASLVLTVDPRAGVIGLAPLSLAYDLLGRSSAKPSLEVAIAALPGSSCTLQDGQSTWVPQYDQPR